CISFFFSAVRDAMESSPSRVVVVHVVMGSKTGLCSPSMKNIEDLQQQYGERLVVVMDACQLRTNLSCVADNASRGFLTLITGSKFFCGPPFSGAVILPAEAMRELEEGAGAATGTLPSGIKDYFTCYEV
ncbi:unnamed protein product, partial [Discosporangium mesarthrocarpum]